MPQRLVIALFLAALALFPGQSQTIAAEEPDEAPRLELLKAVWEENPANLKVALVLGNKLRQEGQADEARSVVKEAVAAAGERMKEEGDSAELSHMLGMAALFLGRNYVALQRFQTAMALQPEWEKAHLGVARAFLALGKRGEALSALELAATLFPQSESVKSLLAEVYFRDGRFDEATPLLEELRALAPDDRNAFDRLLRAYVAAGDAEKAEPLFQELAQRGEISQLEAVLHIFRIRLKNGDLRGARMELQRATRIEEESPLVDDAFRQYYALQASEAEKEENYRRAILYWERALERNPGHLQTRYRMARAHASLNDHEKAVDHYLKILESQPVDPDFYANMASSLLALERVEGAERVVGLGFQLVSGSEELSATPALRKARELVGQAKQALASE